MFDSLQPHGLQQARIPCVSLYPRDCSNPCPLSQWCVQPSHPRFPPLPLSLTLSQHKGLFQWVISLHQVAKVLDLQQQHQSFQWIPRVNFLSVSSVQFSHSVTSNSRQPHGLQHTRPTCPSPIPGVYSNPCPLTQWCHPAISSSVVPFSSCLQSSPASGSFQMIQFFTSDGQSIGVSASKSVILMNVQGWFPLGRTGWLSLQSKELLKVFTNTTIQRHQFFGSQFSLSSNSHIHRTDWVDIHAVQENLKHLLQYHDLKEFSSAQHYLWSTSQICLHDYWKSHTFDYMDLCRQSDVSAF